MSSKINRSYVNCWDREKIQQVLDERIQELKSPDKKSKSRMKLLRGKITRLKKALEGKILVGGQLLPKEDKNIKKAKKTLKDKTKKKSRKKGHLLQDCRLNDSKDVCFRCGSKDHTLKDCKDPNKEELPFATCFVCKKSGHLSSQCKDNPKGIFPKGSGCHFCGSVMHKKVDCPEYKSGKKKTEVYDQYSQF